MQPLSPKRNVPESNRFDYPYNLVPARSQPVRNAIAGKSEFSGILADM